jgi:hypothetical protein
VHTEYSTSVPDSVDLHQHLGPGVGGAVRVGVLVQGGVDDDPACSPVVGVVVVDEDGLADEGPVGLLDLLGGELVVVVVAARGDRSRANIDVSPARRVLEVVAMGLAPGSGHALVTRVRGHRQQQVVELQLDGLGVLRQHRTDLLTP